MLGRSLLTCTFAPTLIWARALVVDASAMHAITGILIVGYWLLAIGNSGLPRLDSDPYAAHQGRPSVAPRSARATLRMTRHCRPSARPAGRQSPAHPSLIGLLPPLRFAAHGHLQR